MKLYKVKHRLDIYDGSIVGLIDKTSLPNGRTVFKIEVIKPTKDYIRHYGNPPYKDFCFLSDPGTSVEPLITRKLKFKDMLKTNPI